MHEKAKDLNDTDNKIEEEFNSLIIIETNKVKQNIFEDGYPHLDRYSNIKPYKHNTVKINTPSKYINASPINIGNKPNLFISTQGPKKDTIEDFWTMVWEYNSKIIIMLCKEIESGERKCENYWEKNLMRKFNITIERKDSHYMYDIRTIKLMNLSKKEERIVYQIHFNGWPDHGIPDTRDGKVFEVFIEINKLVDQYNTEQKPIIVHCSAGVGRTGTFVSMYLLEKEIMKQINDKCTTIRINVFNLVRKIKEMRMYMVQTPIQYYFVYLFVKHLLDTKNV